MSFFFFFNDTATTEIYTLSLHDALPISSCPQRLVVQILQAVHFDFVEVIERFAGREPRGERGVIGDAARSEEHTSELQSPCNLVCRLLLEKKKTQLHQCAPALPPRPPDC